jgi:hypothetical protein
MADPLYDPAVANSGFAGMLDDPRARTALLQFGLQLMQPAYGQSTLGAVGQAIGAGGEAIGRIEAQDTKRTEAESKLAKREADISTQQGRLDVAADRNRIRDEAGQVAAERSAAVAEDRKRGLDIREKALNFQNLFKQQGVERKGEADANKIIQNDAYAIQQKIKDEAKAEAAHKAISNEPFKRDPTLDLYRNAKTVTEIETGLQTNPAYMESVQKRYGRRVPVPGETVMPQPGPQPISGTMESSGSISYPVAPTNPAARSAGQTYQTPRGPLTWTGQGWLAPTAL